MDIKIRELYIEEIDNIFELYEDVFGYNKMLLYKRRFKWEYIDNPATKYAPSKFWVATREDGQYVGFIASFPMRLKIKNTTITTSASGDLMVIKEGRRQGLGQRLSKAYRDSESILATDGFGYQPASGRIYRRLGYQPVYCEPVYARILDMVDLYQFLMDSDRLPTLMNVPFIHKMNKFALRFLNPILSLANIILSPNKSDKLTVVRERQINEQFDLLWEKISPKFPVVIVRNRAFIEWRFINDPNTSHQVFSAYYGEELKGYVAVSLTKRRNLPLGRIMDLFCDPDDDLTISQLLLNAIFYLKNSGAAIISCMGMHPMIRKIIKKYLYLRLRPVEIPALLYYSGDAKLKGHIFDENAWHVGYADGDEGFAP